MREHALELVLHPDAEAAVVAEWLGLRAAELPSQADHRGASNRPHLTLLSAPRFPVAVLDLARREILPLLPLELHLDPVRALTAPDRRRRVVLARALQPPAALRRARDRLLALLDEWSESGEAGEPGESGGSNGASTVGEVSEAGELRPGERPQPGMRSGSARRPWLPHVTLARRLPAADLPAATRALGEAGAQPLAVRADRLSWWDPTRERTTDWPTRPGRTP